MVPSSRFGECVNLFLEVDDDLLVFPAQQVGGLLGFQVYIFQKLAQFAQFCVSLPVDLKLKDGTVKLIISQVKERNYSILMLNDGVKICGTHFVKS